MRSACSGVGSGLAAGSARVGSGFGSPGRNFRCFAGSSKAGCRDS